MTLIDSWATKWDIDRSPRNSKEPTILGTGPKRVVSYRRSVFPIPRFPEFKCFGFFVPMNRSPSPFSPHLPTFLAMALWATFFTFIRVCGSRRPVETEGWYYGLGIEHEKNWNPQMERGNLSATFTYLLGWK